MARTGDWRTELRHIFDEQFEFDWSSHLDELNTRHRFAGHHRLATAATGMPPAWFNGNIEALEERRWALVISLNPSLAREGQYDHVRDREAWWQLWLTYNRDNYYARFFDPIVRVAAAAMGEQLDRAGYPNFAADRMVFVELCPYASHKFGIDDETLAELIENDRGFQIAQSVAGILLEKAKPGIVLVQGNDAIAHVERRYGQALRWHEQRYRSTRRATPKPEQRAPRRRPQKMLRHLVGWYRDGDGDTDVPAAGFPFLRKTSTHNSVEEQRDLGRRIREFHTGVSTPSNESTDESPRTETSVAGQPTARLDVTVGEATRPRLPKNHAIREVVRGLCAAGISPHEMRVHFDRRVFVSAKGSLDSVGFITEQERLSSAGGQRFDRTRWFCRDDQLIYFDGHTHAFTSEWGRDTEVTIERLLAAFPTSGISVTRDERSRAHVSGTTANSSIP